MSQNAHTLLLFFDHNELFKNCLGLFKHLDAEEPEKAAEYGRKIGVDISTAWNDDWFNQRVTPTPKYIRLDYDTSTGYDLPLDVLQQLFDAGLRVACLEVFYDQVGEYGQFYFRNGELVDRETIKEKYAPISPIIEELFSSDHEELEEGDYPRPITIKKLIEQKAAQDKEAKALVDAMTDKDTLDAMINLAKASQETGSDPVELLKSAMLLRALGKGLLQALGFGVVTVLLFKGMWLWIALSVVLAVVLPLIYLLQVNAQFKDDEDSDGDDEELQEEGEATC
jgi:hypothetical protein